MKKEMMAVKDEPYLRIAESISRAVHDGSLPEGSRLQSENKLVELYGENVYTVRKAVAHLKEEGLLYSVPKFGVYVSKRAGSGTVPIPGTERRTVSIATYSAAAEQRDVWNCLKDAMENSPDRCSVEMRYVKDAQFDGSSDLFEYGSLHSDYYSGRIPFLKIREFFPGAIRNVDAMSDPFGVPIAYVPRIVMYNRELLKKMRLPEPEFRNFREQTAWFEEVTEVCAASAKYKIPRHACAAVLRLGSYFHKMFADIQEETLASGAFAEKYQDVFHAVTDYWRTYRICYPKQAEENLRDFLNGLAPCFSSMGSTLLEKRDELKFDCGVANLYSADDKYVVVPLFMTVRSGTEHPVECMRMIRELQSAKIQEKFLKMGYFPAVWDSLKQQKVEPFRIESQTEYYAAMSIFNVELGNTVLMGKPLDDAMTDIYMFTSSYLKMKLSSDELRKQSFVSDFYN